MDDPVVKDQEFWLVREFSALARWSDKSTYRLIKQDPSFPHLFIGGSTRIPAKQARRWLAQRTQGKGCAAGAR